MLSQAKSEINWPFSLRSLMAVRPPWILLPNKRYMLGCLCAICQNVILLLRFANMIFSSKYYASQFCRAINLFIIWNRQHGNPREKNVVSDFAFTSSISGFLDLALHPKVTFLWTILAIWILPVTISDRGKDVPWFWLFQSILWPAAGAMWGGQNRKTFRWGPGFTRRQTHWVLWTRWGDLC